jgi:hypothetical protein
LCVVKWEGVQRVASSPSGKRYIFQVAGVELSDPFFSARAGQQRLTILAFKQRFSFQNYHMPQGWLGGGMATERGGGAFSGLNGHWSTLPDHSTVYTSQGFQMNISEWMP